MQEKKRQRPDHKHRHCGYDNCKSVFMMLVVLWHTAQLYILEATLDSNYSKAFPDGSNDTLEATASWWKRAENHQLFHHPAWTPLVSHIVIRYWLWTEKVAVPGFCFLSGYFGKGFLNKRQHPPSYHGGSDPLQMLETLQLDLQKDQVQWEKTISTLLVGPLLWQILAWVISRLSIGLYTGDWSLLALETTTKVDLWDHLGTWYLFALLIWRTWTCVFLSRVVRNEVYLPFAIALALALLSAHTTMGGPQELRMRLFYFFPYYTAGLYCDESTWQRLILWFGRPFLTAEALSSSSVQVSREMDRISRILGACGIVITVVICQLVQRDCLGWLYSIDNYDWRPHLVFFFQYLLAGSAVVSIILLVKTIRLPLFPFGHANSTLAIYEWHWPMASFLGWGNLPYTGVTVASASVNSFVQYCFSHWSPLPAVLAVHGICYLICVVLGSKVVWRTTLRHLCDPEWACRWIFQPKEQTNNMKHGFKSDGDHGCAKSTNSSGNECGRGQITPLLPV